MHACRKGTGCCCHLKQVGVSADSAFGWDCLCSDIMYNSRCRMFSSAAAASVAAVAATRLYNSARGAGKCKSAKDLGGGVGLCPVAYD
jgi:hypothetical protein